MSENRRSGLTRRRRLVLRSRLARKRARRLALLLAVFIVGFLLCALRFGSLQIIRHASLAEEAVDQRAQTVPLEPSRGAILDRAGRSLTDSRLTYRVAVYPSVFPSAPGQFDLLAEAIGLTVPALEGKVNQGSAPTFVVTGLSPEAAARVMSLGLEGVAVVASETRYGPDSLARHTVGYTTKPKPAGAPAGGEPSPEGLDGLEKAYDSFLAGQGPQLLALFVDGRGQPIDELGWRKLFWADSSSPWLSLPCDIVTTIDASIQKTVEGVMDRLVAKGAVVVMDPTTGDILAMASRPDFQQVGVETAVGKDDGCLINRAVWPYSPGSVFKPAVLAAALETRAVKAGETFECSGTVMAGGIEIGCPARESGGHGTITLEEALALSCNVAFVEIGSRLGQDELVDWSARFGFGAVSGTGLPGESGGALPAPASEKTEPEASFGQGTVEATPLQVARFYSAVANGGRLVTPRLVLEIDSPSGAVARVRRADTSRVMSGYTAAEVTKALSLAVTEGTGKAAAVVSGVAGKTGTAETGRVSDDGREVYAGWFAGFWPVAAPRYVIVVLVEDSFVGGGEAASVFGVILGELARE